jgi:hypothetical protein
LSTHESITEINEIAQRYCIQGLREGGYDVDENSDENQVEEHSGLQNEENNNDQTGDELPRSSTIVPTSTPTLAKSHRVYTMDDINNIAKNQTISNEHKPVEMKQQPSHPQRQQQQQSPQLLDEDQNVAQNENQIEQVTIPPTKNAGLILSHQYLNSSLLSSDSNTNESLIKFVPGYEWSQTFTEVLIQIPIVDLFWSILFHLLPQPMSNLHPYQIFSNFKSIELQLNQNVEFQTFPQQFRGFIQWFILYQLSIYNSNEFNNRDLLQSLQQELKIDPNRPFQPIQTYLIKIVDAMVNVDEPITDTNLSALLNVVANFNTNSSSPTTTSNNEFSLFKQQFIYPIQHDTIVISSQSPIYFQHKQQFNTTTPPTQYNPFLLGSIQLDILKQHKSTAPTSLPTFWWDKCFQIETIPIDLSKLDLDIMSLDNVDEDTRQLIYSTMSQSYQNQQHTSLQQHTRQEQLKLIQQAHPEIDFSHIQLTGNDVAYSSLLSQNKSFK